MGTDLGVKITNQEGEIMGIRTDGEKIHQELELLTDTLANNLEKVENQKFEYESIKMIDVLIDISKSLSIIADSLKIKEKEWK
tara:strand:+ start:1006 stop:1254 length:249 start_codon:yes stop_codon:yes gene_type:complete